VETPPPAPLPEGKPWRAHRLEGKPGADLFPKARLRRLGRAQAMALSAVKLCLQTGHSQGLAAAGDEVAVCLGTAWAELGVELAFLENMIRRGEKGARPAKFASSVHNALASQVAMGFNFTGENHSFTHDALSFEDALWQGSNLVSQGRARRAVVCGVDALTDFLLLRGRELGEHEHAIPGEGAAAFVLAPEGDATEALARLELVRARGPATPDVIDVEEQVAFLRQVTDEAGLSPEELSLLTGAIGNGPLAATYQEVAQKFGPADAGTYRHHTGDYPTAAALGLARAIKLLSEKKAPVLMYHLNRDGSFSAVIVSQPG